MSRLRPVFIALPLLVALPAPGIDYQNDILPIMKEHCWNCHSEEKEVKGDLALDDLKKLARSHISERGSIRPGDPGASDFLARLKLGEGDDEFMPKRGAALSYGDIGKIEAWIKEGAIIDAGKPSEAELARTKGAAEDKSPADRDAFLSWTNPQGKTIEAKFVGLQGEAVKIVGRDGRAYTVPLDKLSAESAAMARKLGGR